MQRVIWVTLFIAGLAACAPSPAPAQPAPIEFQRSGGIIGLNDHLKIDANGHAALTRRTGNYAFDLSRDELSALQVAFQTADFASLPENSMPNAVIPDALFYTVAYQGHTVKTADPAIPKSLEPVIALLNRVIDSNAK